MAELDCVCCDGRKPRPFFGRLAGWRKLRGRWFCPAHRGKAEEWWRDIDEDVARKMREFNREVDDRVYHRSPVVAGVVDLRDESERQMEHRGTRSLNAEDEQLARELVELIQRYDALYSGDRGAADAVQAQIKSIGQQLCADGGDSRMKQVAYRVAALGAGKRVRIRDLELHWDGICGWMY